jgi:hypothetical protein
VGCETGGRPYADVVEHVWDHGVEEFSKGEAGALLAGHLGSFTMCASVPKAQED